jgi:hypothetical protein
MTAATTVKLADLRSALTQLIDHVERNHGAEMELDADHYWVVGLRAAFDLSSEPQVEAAQLSDDIATLQEIVAADADRPIVVWHDLEHLTGILVRIAALDLR